MNNRPRLATVLATLSVAAIARAQEPATAAVKGIESISTQAFTARADAEQPVAGWQFEPVGYARDVGRRRVIRVGSEGDASLSAPDTGAGILLRGTSATARGDLISAPFELAPYHWVEIELEYQRESGEPLVFVGLRPTEDRTQVDLDFVPMPRSKKARREVVRLHSGASKGPYSVAISISGVGATRILSISAEESAQYAAPTKPLCVLDIRTTAPSDNRNENFARVASVFGFPSVEYLHFTEFEKSKLEAIDPAVIVLPGLISLKGADSELMDSVVRQAVEHAAPVVGVCLGHQVLARAHGAKLQRGEREWGPTRISVVKRDPIFEGLPRGRAFHASQSHRFEVARPVGKMQLIASSDDCATQVFRYRGKPWYTFQGHIERGWEVASPEGCLLWKNMLRKWGVIEQ